MDTFKGRLQPTYLTVDVKVSDERSEVALSSQRGGRCARGLFHLQTEADLQGEMDLCCKVQNARFIITDCNDK